MRVVFLGLPIAALALAMDGHEVALAAIPRSDAPGLRRLRRTLGASRVWVKPRLDDEQLFAVAREIEPDLLISWFWTSHIPPALVALARQGAFGVHPSLLPRWRGPDPYFWTIDAGDTVTGVTAHRIDAEYDTGAILEVRRVDIDPSWNAWSLARALDRPSLALLREVAADFDRGHPPVEHPQDERFATPAPTPDDALLAIAWKDDADSIVRRIRAAAPYPGAWTFIGDEPLVVTRAAVVDPPRALLSGEAAVIDGRAIVAAARGGVALLHGRQVREEGETIVGTAEIAELVRAARPPSARVSG